MRSLIQKLVEINTIIDEEDAKSILLNSFPYKYNNVIFNFSQMPSQTLEDIISTLFAKENKTTIGDIKGDPQPKILL